MWTIDHQLLIDAAPGAIFSALTTQAGLRRWWIADCDVQAEVGAINEFRVAGGGVNRMKVVTLSPDRLIEWLCVNRDPGDAWAGTTISFAIERRAAGDCSLRFRHGGWREASEFYATCSFHWARHLSMLATLCETGVSPLDARTETREVARVRGTTSADDSEATAPEALRFLSGILLVSPRPAQLARFYRDVLGIALEDEHHEGTRPHWGCTLGQLHFAIHPIEDFPDRRAGVGSVKLAFTVFALDRMVARLTALGVPLLREVTDTGFFRSAMLLDPDGNLIELTELCDAWFAELERRRAQGEDLIAAWRRHRACARRDR
jgi:uncharacterized protein YndB with AHSA1/START domain